MNIMKKIVLWPNPNRDIGFRYSAAAAALCRSEGVDAVMPDTLAGMPPGNMPFRVCPLEEALNGADCLLALGGDGAILHLARPAAARGIPILGVNLGRLGFMSELEPDELPLLTAVLHGRAKRDVRMMLSLCVRRAERTVHEDLALNDAVLAGGGQSRFLSLCVRAGQQDILTFSGDGVIVATPTGSTAYSMAAGGPVVEPHADSLVVTPICAHLSYAKSMVLSAERTVTLRTRSDKQAVLLVDGQAVHSLSQDDEVVIRRSDRKTTLLRVKPYNFYETLYRKLQR